LLHESDLLLCRLHILLLGLFGRKLTVFVGTVAAGCFPAIAARRAPPVTARTITTSTFAWWSPLDLLLITILRAAEKRIAPVVTCIIRRLS
jgi:hypothetical protein